MWANGLNLYGEKHRLSLMHGSAPLDKGYLVNAWIQMGNLESRPPPLLENHKGFFSNTDPDPRENHKLNKPGFNVGALLASSEVFRCPARVLLAGQWIPALSGIRIILKNEKKRYLCWNWPPPPLTKLSGSMLAVSQQLNSFYPNHRSSKAN